MNETAISTGHLGFCPDTRGSRWEFYQHADHVYRAPVYAPVMPDGYRSGRWYMPLWQWNYNHPAMDTSQVSETAGGYARLSTL